MIDFDGVLRVWDAAIISDAEAAHGLPAGRLRKAVFDDVARLHRAVTGEITDDEWREQIALELEASFGPGGRRAVAQWSLPAGRVDEEVLHLLRRERGRRTIALFSNATTRLDADLDRLGLSDEFDVVFNSSTLGVAKPARAAFVAVAESLDSDPAECFFVDDAEPNIRAAARVGFQTHLYLDPRHLDSALSG